MADPEKLRRAIYAARQRPMLFGVANPFGKSPGAVGFINIREDMAIMLADAAESTLPKTKMVEVWRVEWCHPNQCMPTGWKPYAGHYPTEAEAVTQADRRRNDPINNACVRVTGPHQQEVPA